MSSSVAGFAISAASVSAGNVTVTGAGFGSRAQAAPLKFEDFDSRTVGAAPVSFGYYNYGGFGGTTTVDASAAFSGSKSLLHQSHSGPASPEGAVEESFPHIAVRGFSSQELYLSYRIKFRTNGGRIAQLKFNRSGMEVNGDCYGGSPKFYSSYYPVGPSVNRYDSDKTLAGGVQGGILRRDGTRDEGWAGEASMGSGTVIPLQEEVWYQVEEYYRLNDIGQSNGQHLTWVNGNLQINRNALQVRSDATHMLNCSYLVIGMDYWLNPGSTNGVSVWYDDHYLDTSRARVVLANAATWSAATLRAPLPASAWSGSSITAPLLRSGFAAGQAWLYVVRDDGAVSNSWPISLP
ncbi:hypothetical protein GCM10025770_33420 [Viridibacterium curvum]|uniref:Uncharacterized protein n=1 Tax=Viridibacterium curvum TaxID=1101404 RepID=A0ABP9R150_9RHOO